MILNRITQLAFLLLALAVGSCATVSKEAACPSGTQQLPSCPPLGAVDDPFINQLYEGRTWIPPKEKDLDAVEFGKQADIPMQPAHTLFLGPTDEAARNSLAAKLWMIENAEHTIDFIYYIFKRDLIGYSMLGALCNAVQRGVDVRVVVDSLGSYHSTHPELKALETCAEDGGFMRNGEGELTTRKARVQIVIFNAVSKLASNPNRRSHDKLLVVDGRFPEKAIAVTGGRNISKDYYGIREDGTQDPDPFRDAELLLRTVVDDSSETLEVGELSEHYATLLFLFRNNKRITPGRSDGEQVLYRQERQKSWESLQKLKGFEIFSSHYEQMPQFLNDGLHLSAVRLAHELGNLTDKKVTRHAPENVERNPNSIMHVLNKISEVRPEVKSVRIVSPYLFLARYTDADGNVVIDEAQSTRAWLEENPDATLEIITNSVLTSDNFMAQSVIDMETAPRLLLTPDQWQAWMDASGSDEQASEFVNSEEWRQLVNHPQIFIYETGRLDSVLLGNGERNYGKLHAKFYIEDDLGFIGTTNFDYRSRLYNNEMGFFFLDPGLAEDVHEAFDKLIEISYRWGSPEWFQMRKEVMGLGGMKGRSTRNQRRLYKTFDKTGIKWWL
jgi:phosphatidylserine/phosphatidylglycerophosphate/cardiolipin synthase-like enzyme